MNSLVWLIAAILLSILGAVSSAPGAGGKESMAKTIKMIRYPNEDIYVGELLRFVPKKPKPHGLGILKKANGDEYFGEWWVGKRHGEGIQTRMWNIYRYQGEWSNDKKHGKGTVALFWSFVECEGEWNKDELRDLRGMPICRSVLLQRLVEVTWHYLMEHSLDLVAVLVAVLAVLGLGELWLIRRQQTIRRELAGVQATLSKLEEKLKHDARGDDEELIVGLDQDHIRCGICHEDFATDMQSTDQTTRDMLPVLGSCGHYFCHGCIILWTRNCPKCMKANQFVPGNPTHHRMLIDLLQRARPVEN